MPPLKSLPIPPIVTPLVALVLTTLVLATCSAAPDISMSIHGGVGTSGDDREKSSFTVNQASSLITNHFLPLFPLHHHHHHQPHQTLTPFTRTARRTPFKRTAVPATTCKPITLFCLPF
jgi:hypothetical protein